LPDGKICIYSCLRGELQVLPDASGYPPRTIGVSIAVPGRFLWLAAAIEADRVQTYKPIESRDLPGVLP